MPSVLFQASHQAYCSLSVGKQTDLFQMSEDPVLIKFFLSKGTKSCKQVLAFIGATAHQLVLMQQKQTYMSH